MAKQRQRQMRVEQRGGLAAMQELEQRSDADLERETKNRAAAYAILGGRAAERYDGAAARAWFQKAMAAARPQERPQLRRMSEAALALADRRTKDLRAAAERMGQQAPTGRQMFLLRLSSYLVPPSGASGLVRTRGILLILLLLVLAGAVGTGIVALVALPFGGLDTASTIVLGVLLLLAVLAFLLIRGRRKQAAAQEQRREQAAQQRTPQNRAGRRRG